MEDLHGLDCHLGKTCVIMSDVVELRYVSGGRFNVQKDWGKSYCAGVMYSLNFKARGSDASFDALKLTRCQLQFRESHTHCC